MGKAAISTAGRLTAKGALDHGPAFGVTLEIPGLAGHKLHITFSVLQTQRLSLDDRRYLVSRISHLERERVTEGQASGNKIEASEGAAALWNACRRLNRRGKRRDRGARVRDRLNGGDAHVSQIAQPGIDDVKTERTVFTIVDESVAISTRGCQISRSVIQRQIRTLCRRDGCTVRGGAETRIGAPLRNHHVGIFTAVLQSSVFKRRASDLGDLGFAKIAGKNAVGAENLVTRSTAYRTPVQLGPFVERRSTDHRRGRWQIGTAVLLNGRRITGNLLIVERIIDRLHMRRTVAEVTVVVVGSQVIQVSAVGCTAAIRGVAGEPGARVARANESQSIDDFMGRVVVIIVGRTLQLPFPERPHRF